MRKNGEGRNLTANGTHGGGADLSANYLSFYDSDTLIISGENTVLFNLNTGNVFPLNLDAKVEKVVMLPGSKLGLWSGSSSVSLFELDTKKTARRNRTSALDKRSEVFA